jgi:arabinogalactan endo-1,4-beta-galactosidase
LYSRPGFIKAVDISGLPQIDSAAITFFNADSVAEDMLSILRANGVNTVRLRLWVNPSDGHCSLAEVKKFAESLRNKGFQLWISVHYSDSWADPSQQNTPKAWQACSFPALLDSVYAYTLGVVAEIKPEYIQIGNEINNGLLFPAGNRWSQPSNMLSILKRASAAVRAGSKDAKIIVHYAGLKDADLFFTQIDSIDYDVIGLSYYPIWHGKSLTLLGNTLNNVSSTFGKPVVIAETAYPFTLAWNDYTNNVVGLDSQLILPDYPATEDGQRLFLKSISSTVFNVPRSKGIGFCYWGAEQIAWRGKTATNGSSWENQALFNFDHRSVKALEAFQ